MASHTWYLTEKDMGASEARLRFMEPAVPVPQTLLTPCSALLAQAKAVQAARGCSLAGVR
jgi:hypothetical protein